MRPAAFHDATTGRSLAPIAERYTARIKDLADVARDQARPNRKRYLGRAMARSLLKEAKRSLRSQLAHARNGVAKRRSAVAHLRLVPPPSDSTPV